MNAPLIDDGIRGQTQLPKVPNVNVSKPRAKDEELEFGSFASIMQFLKQSPLPEEDTPDIWDVISAERAEWRTMSRSKSL